MSEKIVAIFFGNFSEQKAQEWQHDFRRSTACTVTFGVSDWWSDLHSAIATTVSGFRSMRGSRSLTRNRCVLCEMRAEDEETVEHRVCGRTSRFGWCKDKAPSDERVRDKTRERQRITRQAQTLLRSRYDWRQLCRHVADSRGWLAAFPCCRQTIISDQDTTVLPRRRYTLQSVILQYINTNQNNAYINAIRNLTKCKPQHYFHSIPPQ